MPFLCLRGYRDSRNIAKAKEKDRRGHGEDMKMPPEAYLGISRGVLVVTGVQITCSVFLKIVIFVDLPLCGTIIKATTEHRRP